MANELQTIGNFIKKTMQLIIAVIWSLPMFFFIAVLISSCTYQSSDTHSNSSSSSTKENLPYPYNQTVGDLSGDKNLIAESAPKPRTGGWFVAKYNKICTTSELEYVTEESTSDIGKYKIEDKANLYVTDTEINIEGEKEVVIDASIDSIIALQSDVTEENLNVLKDKMLTNSLSEDDITIINGDVIKEIHYKSDDVISNCLIVFER